MVLEYLVIALVTLEWLALLFFLVPGQNPYWTSKLTRSLVDTHDEAAFVLNSPHFRK